jgi:CobQ-like glutamine amidotransferase family enzyme
MSKSLIIAHLFPELLNLYADKGNIQTLTQRLRWRGYNVEVHAVKATQAPELESYHLVLLGGGSDREQALVAAELYKQRSEWYTAASAGLPILAVCGGYQLLGEFYQLPGGDKVQGLSILDMTTVPGEGRLIGNIAVESKLCGSIVGFENHGGRTHHHHAPLGTVVSGHGNNGQDRKEGVHHWNIIGTYIHGPLLPKNPQLADFVLETALTYAGLPADLEPLDDRMEWAAHEQEWARHTSKVQKTR